MEVGGRIKYVLGVVGCLNDVWAVWTTVWEAGIRRTVGGGVGRIKWAVPNLMVYVFVGEEAEGLGGLLELYCNFLGLV